MDKACITVAAAHRQMLEATSSAMNVGGLSMLGGNEESERIKKMDRDAAIAEKCQMIATRGFQPLENVLAMREW